MSSVNKRISHLGVGRFKDLDNKGVQVVLTREMKSRGGEVYHKGTIFVIEFSYRGRFQLFEVETGIRLNWVDPGDVELAVVGGEPCQPCQKCGFPVWVPDREHLSCEAAMRFHTHTKGDS